MNIFNEKFSGLGSICCQSAGENSLRRTREGKIQCNVSFQGFSTHKLRISKEGGSFFTHEEKVSDEGFQNKFICRGICEIM